MPRGGSVAGPLQGESMTTRFPLHASIERQRQPMYSLIEQSRRKIFSQTPREELPRIHTISACDTKKEWEYRRAIRKPLIGIDSLPCRDIGTDNTSSANCLSKGTACPRITKSPYAGVVSRLIRVTAGRCSCLVVFIIQPTGCLMISCERICGTTWRPHMGTTTVKNGAIGLPMK